MFRFCCPRPQKHSLSVFKFALTTGIQVFDLTTKRQQQSIEKHTHKANFKFPFTVTCLVEGQISDISSGEQFLQLRLIKKVLKKISMDGEFEPMKL